MAFGLTLPFFGTHRFGVAARRVGSSAFRFGVVLGGLAFGLTASAFRHAPLRSCPRRVGLRAHDFRFRHAPLRGCRSAGCSSGSPLPLFGTHRFGVAAGRVGSSAFRFGVALCGLAFGFTASAFRHAPIRSGHWASSFFRSAGWASGSLLPLFGMHRFGVAARWVGSSAFRFGVVLGGLAFGLTDSAFQHAPLRGCRSAGWFFCLPLRGCRWAGWPSGFGFRFSACTDSEWPLGGLVLPPSASEIALGGLAFGLTASAFRPAPIRSGRWASSFFHLPLRRLLLVGLAFGLTASAFRHAPLRSGRWASWFFRLPLRKLPSAGWPSGSLLPLFGMHRSAPPRRRSEDRRSTTTRHLFHFKTLIPTC